MLADAPSRTCSHPAGSSCYQQPTLVGRTRDSNESSRSKRIRRSTPTHRGVLDVIRGARGIRICGRGLDPCHNPLLPSPPSPRSKPAVLTVAKAYAERILAETGSNLMNRISIMNRSSILAGGAVCERHGTRFGTRFAVLRTRVTCSHSAVTCVMNTRSSS